MSIYSCNVGLLMNESSLELTEAIHMAGCPFVLAVTGGGSRSASALLEVPGASASVLEVVVPYARTALEQWLGGSVDAACSQQTACAMAMVAFDRARQLGEANIHSLRGIAATASLATKRPKKGGHRLHIAWQSSARTVVQSCEWVKDRRSRAEEEQLCAELILHTVATACGISAPPLALPEDVTVQLREKTAPHDWTELVLGARDTVLHNGQNGVSPKLLFPGAFNPIHDGHREMAEIASTLGDQTVVLEVSIENVDKPTLSQTDCICRILPLLFEFPVLLTAAATFVEKSYKNNITFVVGADTIARIGEDRYYNDEFSVDDAISVFSAKGTRFVVFGREMSELQHTGAATKGHFQSLKSLDLPCTLTKLCISVEESSFRSDLSSRDLR